MAQMQHAAWSSVCLSVCVQYMEQNESQTLFHCSRIHAWDIIAGEDMPELEYMPLVSQQLIT